MRCFVFLLCCTIGFTAGWSPSYGENEQSAPAGESWPCWRGPRGDGSWHGPRIAERWPESGLRTVWNGSLGGGYAGVVATDDVVVTMDRQTEPAEVERVVCFDAEDGVIRWSHSDPVSYGDLDYGNGPRAAPTIDGNRVYAVGALGQVNCLELSSGKVVWSTEFVRSFAGRVPTWGFAASPVIYGDVVILQPGGKGAAVVALHRNTGREVWRSRDDNAGYATPIVVRHGDRDQLVCWTPENVFGLDPATGRSLWSVPYEVTMGVSIATPVAHNGIVFVSGYWEGSKAVRLANSPSDTKLLWEENKFLRGLMSQPLTIDGHGYLLDKRYGLTCFELSTGHKLWDDENRMTPKGRNPQASLVRLGDSDRVLILNSDGDLILARIDPSGYTEMARARIIGETWAHPAYSGRHVFARSDTRIVCVELPVE